MKLKLLLSAVIILIGISLFAQSEEDLVKQIRQQFKTINDGSKSYKSESFDIPTDATGVDHTVTTYHKGNQLMKIEEAFLGDMSESSNQYYYWDNKLFFVFCTNSYHAYMDGQTATTTNENRYYFNNNKLIRWLDSEKKQADKNSKEFKDKEKKLLEEATKFLQEYNK